MQANVLNTVQDIDLTVPGSPSLVLHDISEYISLAYLAAFDVQSDAKDRAPQTPKKRVTYIALSKKTMPLLLNLYMRFESDVDIYVDGTVESVLSVSKGIFPMNILISTLYLGVPHTNQHEI